MDPEKVNITDEVKQKLIDRHNDNVEARAAGVIDYTPLTKENFFNELYEKYPDGMKVFCDWIDRYKAEVKWTSFIPEAKFHDLPYAFQLGIWIEFLLDRGGCQWEIEDMYEYNLRQDITEFMKMMHEEAD